MLISFFYLINCQIPEAIFLNGKYYDRLYMDILENEFDGDYIKNKNIK